MQVYALLVWLAHATRHVWPADRRRNMVELPLLASLPSSLGCTGK